MTLKNQKNMDFSKDLAELKMTQTSLFLLNHINIFKNIANNFSTLTYLHTENLINSYLFNKDNNYKYANNVIYLVFKKDAKYSPNIKFNKNNLNVLEVLEEIPETLDYYEDNVGHVFTIKPNNEIFDLHVNLLKNGLYLNMLPLTSKDTISSFINKLIAKEGLYKVMQEQLDIEDIPHPFLKVSRKKETYDKENVQIIDHNDFKILKKFI